MSKETWTDKLRQKMQSHEETPPPGLWDDLSISLRNSTPKPNRVFIFRRWAAAAAVAALFAGGGLYWWQQQGGDSSDLQPARQVMTAQKQPSEKVAPATGEESASVGKLPDESLLAQNTTPHRVKGPATAFASAATGSQPLSQSAASAEKSVAAPFGKTVATDVETADAAPSIPDAAQQTKSAISAQQQAESAVSAQQLKSKPAAAAPASSLDEEQALLARLTADDKEAGAQTAGLQLFASNGFYGSDLFGPASAPHIYRSAPQVRRESHHEQPLSFGLTVSFPISRRLSLATGAVYTRQRSDFTYISKTSQTKDKQTLHYVGVPLTVMGSLWSNNRFHTYAQAGAQADFNVSARTETNGVSRSSDKDGVQFSALLGVGAQYDLLPFMGIYVEPSARYYFDNQSDVSTSFKEHPFKFNLQMGLRFLLNKK